MDTTHATTLRTALETAYINGATASSLAYRPQFVSTITKKERRYSHPSRMSSWRVISFRLVWRSSQ